MNIRKLAEELQGRDVRQDDGDIQLTIFKAINTQMEERFNRDGQSVWDRMDGSNKDIAEYIKAQVASEVEGVMHQQQKGRLFQKLIAENKAFRHQTYQHAEILECGGVVTKIKSVEQISEAAAQKLRQQETSELQEVLRSGIHQLSEHIQKVTGIMPHRSQMEKSEPRQKSAYGQQRSIRSKNKKSPSM